MKKWLSLSLLGAGLALGSVAVAENSESAAHGAKNKKAGAPSSSSQAPSLPVVQYTLDNGLTVILSEDHDVPSVAAQLVYLVGSGHERPGRTGFAHLFEHLMFQGSKHFDHEYFVPFEPIGARTNGNTSSDRTVYYEQVPSQYSELPLWMESDRMRSLLPVLTQEKLDNQREVVKNERRQRYEITPYGMAYWYMDLALYPKGHPYQHATIGSHEDLTAATLEDVSAFFAQYYVPANTGLILVGDFEEEKMRSLVQLYFGDMPSGERAEPPQAAVPEPVNKHWIVQDNIQLPRVYYAWASPALFEDGDEELDLLSGSLSGGKSSRLYQSLVYEKKLAKDVHAYQMSQKLNGVFVIQATAQPGVSLEDLSSSLEAEVKKALSTPPTEAELQRTRNEYKKGFYGRLETYSSRANLLGSYFLHTGEGDYIEEDFNRYDRATAGEIQEIGKELLDFDKAVRLDFVPGDKSAAVQKLEEEAPKKEATK